MTSYEKLLVEAEKLGIKVREAKFEGKSGYYCNNKILINSDISECDKYCILAEEIGHHLKTYGDISNQNDLKNKKQEMIARRSGYKLLIEPDDIVHAMKKGCNNKYEIAEYLNISESCFEEIIEDLKKQYGIGVWVGNYYLKLEPYLGLIKDFGGLFNYK